jgi:hypothetical protein
MKNVIRFENLFLHSIRRLLPAVAAFLTLQSLAAEPAPAGAVEPKTHALFMGADVSIEYNKAMYRVQTVVDGAVIISVDGKDVRVPADWGKIKLKVDRTLKLTSTSASVAHLKGERAYTPGHDPWENFQKGLVQAEAQHGEEAFAARVAGDKALQLANANTQGAGDPHSLAPDPKMLNQAIAQQVQAEKAVVAGADNYVSTGIEPEGQESFDAMRVTFEISADQPLNDPFVVILGQIHEKDDKPGTVTNWFYAQRLDPITTETRKISLLKGGFPFGFEPVDFQVHLYNRGREIATDVAPKRVLLTREEAFTYARMEYQGSNKGASLPAKPFMGKLSKEAKTQLSTEQLAQPYYVQVSKDGMPQAAFLDAKCSRPVDQPLTVLISSVRFYPALDKGRPVDGVAELKFNLLNF